MKNRNMIVWALILCLPLLFKALPAGAAETEEINNGQDMTKPLARLDLRYEYQNAPKQPSNHDDSHIITVRMDRPFDLAPGWKLATRLDVPLMFTNRFSDDNLHGRMHFGLSDMLAQALLVNIVDERFAWAVGAQLVFPTATEDEMGLGKYRVVPTVAARWATNELVKGSWIALAGRWDKDFAESRDNSTKVNELQFAPVINIPLPNYWFINLFPSTDIRYNMGEKRAADTGRWFVPANVLIGKMLSKDIVASVEVGVPIIQEYQVYDFKMEARIGFFF